MKNRLYELLPLLFGTCLAIILVNSFSKSNTKFEEAALGEATSSYMATVDGYPIHNCGINAIQDSLLLSGWKQRGSKPVEFFLGNSQTHGVNRMKQHDVNYVKMLEAKDVNSGFDILANSVPNGNLQEFYLIYAHYAEVLPIHTLFVPVFMDDLRETGIREFFFGEVSDVPAAIRNDSSTISQKINSATTVFQQQESATGDMAALDQTVQATSEAHLNQSLNENWMAWSKREQVRGNIFNSMYQLRNTIFRITPQTKRKMVKGTYEDNFEALEALLQLANQNKTQVIVYIPPLRNDVPPPYDANQYNAFKGQVEALSQKYNATFANLEGIVPGPQWGMKASTNTSGQPEYDFMHFTAEGHRLLAEALLPLLQTAEKK